MRRLLLSVPGIGRLVDVIRASYRRKLLVALVGVFLIAAAMATVISVQIGVILDENVEQSMTAAAKSEADELTEWTSQNKLITRVLSEHPALESGDDTAIRDYLQTQRTAREETDIVNAYVIDRRNLTVETSAQPELEGQTVSELPWKQQFAAFQSFDDVAVTQPYKTANGTTVVGFITPIRERPGHLLVVSVNAESLFTRYQHPVEGGFTRIVDSNGTVVFADSREAALQQYTEGSLRAPVVSAGLRGEAGFKSELAYERSAPEGTDYVAAYAPVEGTDWVVIEHAPAKEAYAVTRQARTWIGGVGVVALLGLMGVVVVLGRDVTSALSELSRRAELIADGQFDVSFDVNRSDEFGDLNRTLATTRDALVQHIDDLETTTRELEASTDALEERSAMVSVLNRIFRHNMRNDINVIAGRAEHIQRQIEDEQLREELAVIQRKARGLAEISEQTQHIEQLVSDDQAEETAIHMQRQLEPVISEVRSSSASASVSLTAPDDPVVARAVSSFPVLFGDIVTQLIAHNDGDVAVDIAIADPSASSSDCERDGTVVITVDDDGCGLPEMDIKAIIEGTETPLRHADGLALWTLAWAVDRVGGELIVDSDEVTLEIRLPTADTEE